MLGSFQDTSGRSIMTSSHNVVFLLDTADSAEKDHLHLAALRILNFLGCKFGLAKVRWDFKFFDSMGIRGRASRVGSFRALGSRSWEDFEEVLEARFGKQLCPPCSPGPTPRSIVTRNILKETLLDYQWDRPEIVSPTKPVLRSQKNKLTVIVDNPPAQSTHAGFANAIFIFSPCPHSRRELWQFISGNYAPLPEELPPSHDLAEKFLPKGIQDMMVSHKVTLYWMDTTDWSKLLDPPDHVGYLTLLEVMRILGGTILPSEVLTQHLDHQKKRTIRSSSDLPSFTPWTKLLPLDSSLNFLFSSRSSLQTSFPNLDGVLLLKADGKEESRSCAVVLEPLTLNQRHFEGTVTIQLKCTMTDWKSAHVRNLHTESWTLQSKPLGPSAREISWFQQFVKYILAQGLHMVAEVTFSSGAHSPCTGIFSPVSGTTAILSLLFAEQVAEAEGSLLQPSPVAENFSKEGDFGLPEVVSSVLRQVMEDSEEDQQASPDSLCPGWVQQELSSAQTWSPAVLEDWYSVSNFCGASSRLMESFRMLQASSTKNEEETPKSEAELRQSLAEFYQKKVSERTVSSHPRDQKKRCAVPRTPIRQKMKTMPRSLQMLNAAMFNVKAQKHQPEGELPVDKKPRQRLLSRKLGGKGEGKGRKRKCKIDFSTEDEMLSYLNANYQNAMMDGENLFARSQDMATCLDTIQRHLLKTTNTLRQQLAADPDKETGIKECQLQVYLRLEICLQRPSLQNNTDRMEQLVQEMTELLRVLCLAKDPGYLSSFLEEVVDIYLESMPKTLGDLYYSLGTEIPTKLASVLPTDFFSDDSIAEETQSVSLPASAASLPLSKAASLSAEADELEELRTRSAKKRKHPLARHRSITEMSQNLRQIEIPQASWNHRRKDTSHGPLDAKVAAISKKTGVQEVTKVRRNLFNEETLPLGKSSLPKMARSQSVSVLEELKHKRSRSKEDIRAHHKLLTKRVAETPLHKQMSRRLLQRQITGRCSDPGSDVGIVEESPEKTITYGLRRSPRIKQLMQDKFLSSNIRSLEPNKKNTPQVHSAHLEEPGLASPPAKAPQSPKSILFGEVLGGFSFGRTSSPQTRRKQLTFDEPLPQESGKSYFQSSQELLNPKGSTLRRSPRIQEKARRTPQKTPALKNSVAKCLGNFFSPARQKSKSLPISTENRDSCLPWIAEKKNGYPSSPKAAELQTPEKPPFSDMLDDVFALPADGPESPIVLSPPSSPFALQGKPCSEPSSPRCSLRIAPPVVMPTVLAENRTFEIRRNTCPEPVSSVDFPSLLPEASSAAFKDAHPELGLTHIQISPNIRTVSESALEIRSVFQSDGISPFCDGSAKAVSPCTLSPAREKLGRNACSPQETQGVRKTSPIKALGSPPSLPRVEHPSMGSRSLGAEASPFIKPGSAEDASLDQRPEPTTKIISPTKRKDSERRLSPTFSSNNPRRFAHAVVLCEKLDLSKSLSDGSPADPGSASSLSSAEDAADGQPLFFSSPPRRDRDSPLAISKPGSGAYALRCTADRRQREAAARLEKEEKAATSKTLGATATPLTYEVELEMQASGLPKLRIRKVASEVAQQPPLDSCDKLKGEENDRGVGDVSAAWCSRHPEKLELISISPSCVRSAHNTPGKFGMGGQTYICHSYSPTTLCTSSTSSPSQGSAVVPWTPSPKRKGKVTPEAIKDWPRRKRAAVGCSRSERPAEAAGEEPAPPPGGKEALELFSSRKVRLLGDLELEGIEKLQDQFLGSDTEGNKDENIYRSTLVLESRKRAQEHRALGEEASQESKRPCLTKENPGAAQLYSTELMSMGEQTVCSKSTISEDIFNFSDTTPPKPSGNGVISASGLWALEQSPLLYKGPPATQRKCPKGEDPDTFGAAYEDFSLFRSTPARKRSITRTYSRKRPLC
ncbi:treslin isoform X2 [Ahaetulla prasina]|uniref:treslin isoform X2 n=1 Tax=Ahaetulla prasina TaxID=499056 RepID=UPI00264752C2|nr:treslin isoform X2 [Ahaetulla prasina]